MSGGTFKVARSIWTHEAFAREPFTEREAFMWMVGEASYRPRERRIGKYVAKTERGQLAASVRFMADAWGWKSARVHRFLKRLENRDTVRTNSETGILVITICSYEDFQFVPQDSETVARQSAIQKRDSSETNEKKDKKDSYTPLTPQVCPIAEVIGDDLARDFLDHRRKLRKPMTDRAKTLFASSLTKIRDAGHDPCAAVDLAIERGWQSVNLQWLENEASKTKGNQKDDQLARILDRAKRADQRAASEQGMAGREGGDVPGPLFPSGHGGPGVRGDGGGLDGSACGSSPAGNRIGDMGAPAVDGQEASSPRRDTGGGAEIYQLPAAAWSR